jgi:hypothetical protein
MLRAPPLRVGERRHDVEGIGQAKYAKVLVEDGENVLPICPREVLAALARGAEAHESWGGEAATACGRPVQNAVDGGLWLLIHCSYLLLRCFCCGAFELPFGV